jgi:SpoVK/Ycf46/Vps4 family AAA+-type ATPase
MKPSIATGVVFIGAANYPARVDFRISRSKRFDLHIALKAPDKTCILSMFKIVLGDGTLRLDNPSASDQLLGKSGAQVAAVVRDAYDKAR